MENLQDQALTMLRNHIEGPHGIAGSGSGSNLGASVGLHSSTSTLGSNSTRFGRLLMLLANLRVGNAHRIEKTFFEKSSEMRKWKNFFATCFNHRLKFIVIDFAIKIIINFISYY